MAAPARQHVNGFIGGVRFVGKFLSDEWAAWRAGVNRVEDTQLVAGQTFPNAQIAHNRACSPRHIDLTNAPFGDVPHFPMRRGDGGIVPAQIHSMPAMQFSLGQVSFPLDGRVDAVVLFITRTIGIRRWSATGGAGSGVDPGKTLANPDGEITLDIRLVRATDTLFYQPTDDDELLSRLAGATHTYTYQLSPRTALARAPIIGGPVRISTGFQQAPDILARPGVPTVWPLALSDFRAGDSLVLVCSTPRFAVLFGEPAPTPDGAHASPTVENLGATSFWPYTAAEGVNLGAAHMQFDLSYEAQP